MKNKIIGTIILFFSVSVILTGCGGSTNSLVVKGLEKTQKTSFEALKHSKKFALIDTRSENYQKWKNSIVNKGRPIKFDRYNKCVDELIGKYHTADVKDRRLREFKQCSNATKATNSSVIVGIEDNKVWGLTIAAYKNVWFYSNLNYTNFTVANFAVIENDNGTAEVVAYTKSKQYGMNNKRQTRILYRMIKDELNHYKIKIL